MSNGVKYLHSHSGLERELKFPKHTVLVDEEYGELFKEKRVQPLKYAGIMYLKVPTLSFIKNGGVFKNFMQ